MENKDKFRISRDSGIYVEERSSFIKRFSRTEKVETVSSSSTSASVKRLTQRFEALSRHQSDSETNPNGQPTTSELKLSENMASEVECKTQENQFLDQKIINLNSITDNDNTDKIMAANNNDKSELESDDFEETSEAQELNSSSLSARNSSVDLKLDNSFSDSFTSSDIDQEDDIIDGLSSSNSGKIMNIMNELLENEENYVHTLEKGINNYITVMQETNLPPGLVGQQYHVFGNIERIYEFHRDFFLPKLEENCCSIEGIAETFINCIERDNFYNYILYALNRPKSEKISTDYLEFFQERQNRVGDKLGLNSFLLQPIQRLPRYRLLLNEIIKELLKIDDMQNNKKQIGTLCKAEKKLQKFIDTVNESMSINDIIDCYEENRRNSLELMSSSSSSSLSSIDCSIVNNFSSCTDIEPHMYLIVPRYCRNPDKNKPINLLHQGKFKKMFIMDMYDWEQRRRYHGKMFLFEKCIVYTEAVGKKKLEYRGHYMNYEVGLHNDGKNKLILFAYKRGQQEIEVTSNDVSEIQRLATMVENILKFFGLAEKTKIQVKTLTRNETIKKTINNRNSILSNFSNRNSSSSNSSGDCSSYDSSQTKCDEEELVKTLHSSQVQFCKLLESNRKYYIENLAYNYQTKLTKFVHVFDKIRTLHEAKINGDFPVNGQTVGDLCGLFIKYFEENQFKVYYDYLKHFKLASKILKIALGTSDRNSQIDFVEPSVDCFLYLPIVQMMKFNSFFHTILMRHSELICHNQPIDKEMFKKIAFIQVKIENFTTNIEENFKLFNMDDKITIQMLGYVVHSEQVSLHSEYIKQHRIMITQMGIICVKFDFQRTLEKFAENYISVVFYEKFYGYRTEIRIGDSKKSDKRLNIFLGPTKYPIDFKNVSCKNNFYEKYLKHCAMVKKK